MKVVILAAGYGTRLLKDLQNVNQNQLTDLIGVPKPLLPIGGLPLISYWIEALKARDDTKDIFVITNDIFYNKFKDWVENYPCVTIINDGTCSNEDRLGAVPCLQLVIEKCKIDDHVMVIGGDTIFYEDFHLQDVIGKYETLYQGNNQANLVLSYICKDEEIRKYGILETDQSQRITAVKEKPSAMDTSSRQACPCFYVFSKYTLPFVKEFLTEKKNPHKTYSCLEQPFQGVYCCARCERVVHLEAQILDLNEQLATLRFIDNMERSLLLTEQTLVDGEMGEQDPEEAPIGDKDAPGHFLSWLVIRKPVYFHPISGRFDVGNLESYIMCNEYFQEKIKNITNYLQ